MSKRTNSMLLGACAIAAMTTGFSTQANAVTKIYGGGSSLIAPYARQAEDCYGVPTDLVVKAVPPSLITVTPFNYVGSPAMDCSTTHVVTNREVFYISTGSGTGIKGVYSHDAATQFGDTDPNTGGNQFWPSVEYGFSETSLDSVDVGIYNNGGSGGHVGLSVKDQAGGGSGVDNPRVRYGALVQFPVMVAPVAVAYDPVYKKVRNADSSITEYKFFIKNPRADGSGGLRLDATTYCKIFNGQITDWNDPALKALNGNASLKDPADPTSAGSWSVPMQITGRFDSSGTTSLFTRHIANVCAALAGNAYADATTTLPAALHTATGSADAPGVHGHYNKTQPNDPPPSEALGQFTLADGNDGVAKYLDFTKAPGATAGDSVVQGRIGYVGADYVLPGALNNPGDPTVGGYALNSANLKNASNRFVAPTASGASAGFGALLPPQSFSNGKYDAGSSDPHHRNRPEDWVEPASKTSPLANPTALNGYPIVGTANFIGYTCYATKQKSAAITGFLGWFTLDNTVEDDVLGLLGKAGLSPLPHPWLTAIRETFVRDKIGLGLNIDYSGNGPCVGVTPGG